MLTGYYVLVVCAEYGRKMFAVLIFKAQTKDWIALFCVRYYNFFVNLIKLFIDLIKMALLSNSFFYVL